MRTENDLVVGRREISEVLGVSQPAVEWLHVHGRLPATRLGHVLIANRSVLEAAMRDWGRQGRRKGARGRWGQEERELA